MFGKTWQIVLGRAESQSRMRDHGGRLVGCMICQIRAVCSMGKRPLPRRAGHQLELRAQLLIAVERSGLVARAQADEGLVV